MQELGIVTEAVSSAQFLDKMKQFESERKKDTEKCKEFFRQFDADGSGSVTKAELCKLLTGRNCDKVTEETGAKAIEAFIDSYDTSGDGTVDFDD